LTRLERLRADRRRHLLARLAAMPAVAFILIAGLAGLFLSPIAEASGGGGGGGAPVAGKPKISGKSTRAKAARIALAQVGDPYRYGSNGPRSFDCSGLTSYAYARAGKAIPRTSSAQRRFTKRVSLRYAKPGDLLHYGGHVEMYVGKGLAVAANQTGRPVNVHKVRLRGLMKVGRVT
jgi:cell wall-associated NlpC family hydrolase